MLGRKIVILKLYALTILGKNSKKSDVVRKSGLFAEYGGGGVLASSVDSIIPRINSYWK